MGRPVAEGLFVVDEDGPVLLGSRCRSCAAVRFPAADACQRCGASDVETTRLPRRGTLWSFTVQGFRPKSPPYSPDAGFEPYGVGYVDLGEIIVEGRLTENDPARLHIGMDVELTLVPFTADVDTFGFAPA